MQIRSNRLYCKLEKDFPVLFFSIMDYLNSFFTSDKPEDIIKFYSFFNDSESLINWIRKRPKGHYDIFEVEGNKDIIVVIPTADFNGKFAKTCREEIFKGHHIIFVQSGGKEDYYFNFSHNSNVGIKKALEYNPKWIVCSNDDMYKIDDIEKLISKLSEIDENKIDAVFTRPSLYHSVPYYIGKITCLYKIYLVFTFNSKTNYLQRKFDIKYIYTRTRSNKIRNLAKKYLLPKLYRCEFINFSDFLILSANYFKKNDDIFDETYLNEGEDTDLSFRLLLEGARYTIIDYKIGDLIGSTIGTAMNRNFRSLYGLVYFNYKFRNILNRYNK
jgi:hypothetical protein